ncbi:MAG: arginine--tRNA ligase [Acidobacteria bacterium]|nr:arginine--tRNA ligase [Acidobacteriota bacterium]
MILSVQRLVHRAIADAIRRQYGLAEIPVFAVEVPPTRALGDLAVPVAFQLARTLRKAPRAIAQELAQTLGAIPGVARVEPAPNGYLNLYLDRSAYLLPRVRQQLPHEAAASEKTIVEHTAINPNKAAHIGHLRNAVLGDALGRVLRLRGTPVEIQNYIDDLGVQVADIIVGFRELEHRTLDDVRQIADTTRIDYYCWDLYSRVTQWYDERQDHLDARARTLHELEHGDPGVNDTAAMGAFIVDRIVRAHLATMARLNIAYDLLTYEGDIVRLQFWAHAFETLKAQNAIYLQTEGKLAGCWVMKIEEASPADARGDAPGNDVGDDAREKVIVRSNGVVTYIGKDLANQFWKLGLLGRDFHYRVFATQANGRALWATTSGAGEAGARELGYSTDGADASKPFVEVSGRKGLGVKIDDLLDLLTNKATAEVAKRNPEFPPEDCRRVGSQIAVAAIRYFMLKYSRGKLIVFDIEEALSFEGETGPYLQYAAVRANNIFHKLQEREHVAEAEILSGLETLPAVELADDGEAHNLWAVVFEASRLDEVVEQVVRSLEFSGLAKYAFGLAQLFSAFYHRYPILNEEQADRKRWRAAGVAYFRMQLTRALDLMGIEVPSRM